MIHQDRFIEAMKDSGVKNVALIDDAFDPPLIDNANSGALLDFLEDGSHANLLDGLGLPKAKIDAAIAAINVSDFESDDLSDVVQRLYDAFVEDGDAQFDPGNVFADSKAANLAFVRPLLKLLKKCDPPLQIVWAGADPADFREIDENTDLIFLDFYLNRAIGPEGGSKAERAAGRQASLEKIKELINQRADRAPSVVLMSSHNDVAKHADEFRQSINGGGAVYASRFGFLEKKQIELKEQGVDIQPAAADTLLDIVQSFEWARALHLALEAWLAGATDAVAKVREHAGRLTLKDLAYLVRFRLADEGQGLLEYLEWFFGECLLDEVSGAVDAAIQVDPRIEAVDGTSVGRIEGAFDGPTEQIARLYHKVRIQAPRPGRQQNYRLGDLYVSKTGKKVAVVVTPDCDLISRPPDQKRNAERLLMMGGKYVAYEKPDVTVSDFLMLGDKPHNLIWNKKIVTSEDFAKWPKPGQSNAELTFVGTLRPMYAQAMQRSLLDDLGRIGLSVAPALSMAAAAKVFVANKGGAKKELTLAGLPKACVYLVPGRNAGDKPKVVFIRRFASALLSELTSLDAADYPTFDKLKKEGGYSTLEKMFQAGVELESRVGDGQVLITVGDKPGDAKCWIKVSLATET